MAARHTFDRVWLEKHIECLRTNVAGGLSASTIATVLNNKFRTNFSRSAVISKCHVLKLQLKQSRGGAGGRASKTYKAKSPPPAKVNDDQFVGAVGEPPEEGKCHYVRGEGDESIQACGLNAERNKQGRKTNYCAYHQTVMYQPSKKRHAQHSGRQRQTYHTQSIQVSR